MRSERRAFAVATTAHVLGWIAHVSLVYYLAPVALRLADAAGRDAWIFAGTSIASVVAVLPAGRLADRYPRRRVLRAGLVVYALSYVPLLAWPASFEAALAGTLLSGVALVLTVVSFNSYVADLLSGARRSAAYGNTGALTILAGAVGPFVAAAIFRALGDDVLGIRVNSALFALGAATGALLTLRLPQAPASRQPLGHDVLAVWRDERRVVRPVALMYVVTGIGYGLTYPYFAVYFLDLLGVSKVAWGVVLGAATVASAAGSLAAGRLAGRFSPLRVALVPQVVLFAAVLAFLFPVGFVVLAGAFLARNLLSTTVAPTVNTLMMSRVADTSRARAQAWASLAWNVGWTVGAATGGLVLARVDGALFPLGAAVGVAGVAAGFWMLARDARPA